VFFIIGILFKVQHWPGAGTILILAMLTGVLCLIPALLVNRFRILEKKSKRLVYILGATGLIFFMAGISCKLQHWPLAGVLMVSSIILFCIFLFMYTRITWKEEAFVSSRFLFIIIGSVAMIIPGAMINLNLQYSYEDGFYPNQDQQQAIYSFLYANNNSLMLGNHDTVGYARMEQIHSKTAGLLTLISDIQVKMVQESEGEPGMPAVSEDQIEQTQTGPLIRYRLLSRPFHPNPVRDFLQPGCITREELNRALSDYKQIIPGYTADEELQKYTSLLEPSTYLPENNPESATISLMSGLHSLELLKNGILTAEAKILTTIAGLDKQINK
jgi:Ca2+/Na+ antiporter